MKWLRLLVVGSFAVLAAIVLLIVLVPVPGEDGAVSAASFEGEWPLTVDNGVVRCERGVEAVFEAPDGATYALNGAAQSRYPSIDPIWREGVLTPRVPLAPLLALALERCE